jgi:DNA modification methylase
LIEFNRTYNCDCTTGLKMLDDETINCCVTSPPYYNLRDYGADGQIGLEGSPDEYIFRLVEVFREVKRVLRNDGTLWVNMGDTYCSTAPGTMGDSLHLIKESSQETNEARKKYRPHTPTGMKPKDLMGIPWMLAFALRADGWYLRQDIIWQKPNPMPESVRDRCTKSHEYIFLFSKSPHYYFDAAAIAEPVAESTVKRLSQDIENQKGSDRVPGKTNGTMKAAAPRYGGKKYTESPEVFNRTKSGNAYDFHSKRNKRDVWSVCTKPFKGAHFATFPPNLILPCILSGSREGGTILDPFMGSGTTMVTANGANRNCIGFDINPDYCKMSNQRGADSVAQQSLFKAVVV